MNLEVQQRLDAFRSEISLSLAIGILADMELPVVADDGSFPVLVALEEEPLSVLLDRLRAVGSYATVFVAGVGRIRIGAFLDSSCALDADAAEDFGGTDPDAGPHAASSVGMFFDYLAIRPNGVRLPRRLPDPPALVRSARELALS